MPKGFVTHQGNFRPPSGGDGDLSVVAERGRNSRRRPPTVLNILKRDKAKLSLSRNRLKASVNPIFRAALLAYLQI